MPRGAIIDGQGIAAEVRGEVKARVDSWTAAGAPPPHLAVVLASNDPASALYVRNKSKAAAQAGIRSTQHMLDPDAAPAALLDRVAQLNADDDVDGILVQLPLPPQHDTELVIRSIRPDKDVDGLHPENAGRLSRGDESQTLVPCTPRGSLRLIEESGAEIRGARAVVVGRSRLVGRPMADLLVNRHATVTICHSRTRDLPDRISEADIVVAAIGKPQFVRGTWIKFGATVIDVGINRNENGKLVGDVAFTSARERAKAITPVPKGVGPMTVAHLLDNTVRAFERRRNS